MAAVVTSEVGFTVGAADNSSASVALAAEANSVPYWEAHCAMRVSGARKSVASEMDRTAVAVAAAAPKGRRSKNGAAKAARVMRACAARCHERRAVKLSWSSSATAGSSASGRQRASQSEGAAETIGAVASEVTVALASS